MRSAPISNRVPWSSGRTVEKRSRLRVFIYGGVIGIPAA